MRNHLTVEQSVVKMSVKPIPNKHWNKVRKHNKEVNLMHDKLEESLMLSQVTLHKEFTI